METTTLEAPSKSAFSHLDSLRHKTDPVADKVVAEIISNEQTFKVNHLFDYLVKNNDEVPEAFPKIVHEYFEQTAHLPEWADKKQLKIAQAIYADYGPQFNMILLCKSLPYCYSCANGAIVLHDTGRLSEHDGSLKKFTRRLAETAQFVVTVLSPDNFEPSGNAIRTIQKVRLMHASIRYFLKQRGFDAEKYGEPINQEDMLGTMLSFSTVIGEGLEQLGIQLTGPQKEALLHTLKVTGYILGIDPNEMPANYSKGLKLQNDILEHQMEKSEWGIELQKACIDFMDHVIPGNLFQHVPEVITRYLSGDKIADQLEIEDTNGLTEKIFPKFLKTIFKGQEKLEDHSFIVRKLTEAFNHALIKATLNYFNENKSTHFYIPPSLQKSWKLNETWEDVIASPSIFNRRISIQKKINQL